ncbi:hypothetical protein [Desulfovibrio falkowii]|uniref:Uncharacterized protein n=1 Tax=Desulfovibrio falkowii TaxID=3136602 RepID=A0ABQ0E9X1_9BACT
MKKLFACLLFLLLALPAHAENKEEDDPPVYETLIIRPNIKNADNEAMPAIIEALTERIKAPAVLGDAAGKIIIEPTFASSLEYGTFSLEKYPQLKEYKEAVQESYAALKLLKQKPEFAQGGLNTPPGKEWKKRNDAFYKKYEHIQLPFGYENAFTDLNALASDYMYIRHAKNFSASSLNSWEETSFTFRHRIENTVNMAIDD